MTNETRVTVENGKYTFVVKEGRINILRYGEPWVQNLDCPGSKAVMALIDETEQLLAVAREANITIPK